MKLKIYRNNELINTIENEEFVLANFIGHIYDYARKNRNVKQMKTNSTLLDIGDVRFWFENNDDVYEYTDIPFKCGYIDSYKLVTEITKKGE